MTMANSIEVNHKAPATFSGAVDDIIMLDHIQREKGRLKVTSRNGDEVCLFLERGQVLQCDEVLHSQCNRFIRVKLAKEEVVTARASSWPEFSRACYHLGNRHVRLQLGNLWLRFLPDPVLEGLMKHLGLETVTEQAAFEPESGAYGFGHSGKSSHHHDHE